VGLCSCEVALKRRSAPGAKRNGERNLIGLERNAIAAYPSDSEK